MCTAKKKKKDKNYFCQEQVFTCSRKKSKISVELNLIQIFLFFFSVNFCSTPHKKKNLIDFSNGNRIFPILLVCYYYYKNEISCHNNSLMPTQYIF